MLSGEWEKRNCWNPTCHDVVHRSVMLAVHVVFRSQGISFFGVTFDIVTIVCFIACFKEADE